MKKKPDKPIEKIELPLHDIVRGYYEQTRSECCSTCLFSILRCDLDRDRPEWSHHRHDDIRYLELLCIFNRRHEEVSHIGICRNYKRKELHHAN